MKKATMIIAMMLALLVVLTGCKHERPGHALVYATEMTNETVEEFNESCDGFVFSVEGNPELRSYFLDEDAEVGPTLHVIFVADHVDIEVEEKCLEKLRISDNCTYLDENHFRFEEAEDYTIAFKENAKFNGKDLKFLEIRLVDGESRRSAK